MIHQVFLDALNHSYLAMENVCLLVIDECHHTVGNSPYVQIFENHYHPLKRKDSNKVPHILSLSASIVPSKCTMYSFPEKKQQLESTLDSKVVTTYNLSNLLQYVTNPEEKVVQYDPDPSIPKLVSTLESKFIEQLQLVKNENLKLTITDDKVSYGNNLKDADAKLKKYKRYISRFVEVLRILGLYCGKNLIDEEKSLLERDKIECFQSYESKMIEEVKKFHHEITEMINIKINIRYDNPSLLTNFTTKKVKNLLKILLDPFDDITRREEIVAIVFVKQRAIATSLAFLINAFAEKYPDAFAHLRVGFALGGQTSEVYKNPGAKKISELDKERRKLQVTLDKFQNGELNCIISTEVLEEGLDVHNCNLVIRFDGIPNFRAYVQSKGRARARETSGQRSQYIMMAEKDSKEMGKLMKDLEGYRELDRYSIKFCHGNENVQRDDKKCLLEEDDSYYTNPADPILSPRVTRCSAISLVYRYTQNIPIDRYTKLKPYFEVQYSELEDNFPRSLLPETEMYRCILHMPHKTPYSGRPFNGPPCATKKRAKQEVAKLACKKMHEDGLLGDDLLPKKRNIDVLVDGLSGDELLLGKRGKSSRKDYYNIGVNELKFDPCLENYFLYKISTKLVNEATNPKYSLFRPELYDQKIGILVNQEISPIAHSSHFLYIPSGRISVFLEPCGAINLSDDDIDMVNEFQCYAFDNVMGSTESWMWLGKEEGGALIVPIDKYNKIDKKVICNVFKNTEKIGKNKKDSVFEFERSNYINVVVAPTHKITKEHYFVEEIIEGSNPNCKIDENGNETFEMYYKRNFGLEIQNKNQELLKVSGADHRYDMFSEFRNNGSKIRSTKRNQKFLPELVRVEPIPASLWRELQWIPFLIVRLTSLLR